MQSTLINGMTLSTKLSHAIEQRCSEILKFSEACAVAKEIPVAMMKPLKDELQDLQRREIIKRVECSMDWISGMVAVQKQNGKPRVCTDQKPLNKALKHCHFLLPTIEDILSDLAKTKCSPCGTSKGVSGMLSWKMSPVI